MYDKSETEAHSFAEPRIADEGEQISELNVHVWDSVDRIYLCKKDIEKCSTPPLPRKKRGMEIGSYRPLSQK